jgi:hypothetical protein
VPAPSPPPAAPALPDSVAERRLGRALVRIVGDGTAGPYALGAPFVFAGSESVAIAGAPLPRGAGYTLDANRGSILFSAAVPAGDTIAVAYRRLPLPPAPSYARWLARPVGTPAESVAAAPPAFYGRSLFEAGGLRVGGTKSVALVVGSEKDLTLEQALRVSIEGALSRDVTVVGRLSDENLPFTPEGSSARLEELDKVFVEIRAPNIAATLGDYEVDFQGSEFARYRRVLKGALGRVESSRLAASASAGVSRGRFASVELRGVEGRQGPYRIVEGELETVVAGSEEVYLDGERMARGEDNDYVIDYSRGEIRFTSRRPLRTGSRIAADFQATGDDYKRGFVAASARGRLGGAGDSSSPGAVALGLSLLSESDDSDSPTGILLSDADRESLSAAGDVDPVVSGASFVGTGGDYDTTGGRFVFAGKGRGAFFVDFTFVGAGRGRYDADLDPESGDRIFVFDASDSIGDYDPIERIPRPSAHRVLAADVRGAPLRGLSLDAAGAASWLDANTLSARDDGDNDGAAWRVAGSWRGDALRAAGMRLGDVALTGRARRLGERFAAFSRVQPVHLDARWNTEGFEQAFLPDSAVSALPSSAAEELLPYSEEMIEGEMTYRPMPALGATIEAGTLERGGLLDARREAVRVDARGARLGRIDARAERVRSDGEGGPGRTDRLGASAGTRIGAFEPGLALSREDRRRGSAGALAGSRRDRGAATAALSPHPTVRLGAELALEAADVVDRARGDRRDWFHADEQGVSASLASSGALSLSSRYRRRHVNYTSAVTDPDATSHLGRVEMRHRAWDGALSSEWNYDATTFSAARRRRVLIEVPDGEVGDFDSLGNVYPGRGRFRARDIELPAVPTTDLAADVRVVVAPGERRGASAGGREGAARGGASGWSRVFAALRLETLARVSERSTTTRKGRLLLFSPSEFQRDDTTLRGETLLREEASWSSASGATSVRGRLGRVDVEDNIVEGARREELRHEGLVRVRRSVSERVAAQAEWEPRRSRQRINGGESSRLLSDFVQGEATLQPGPLLSISVSGRAAFEREARLGERLDSLEGAVSASATLLRRGRLSTRVATLRFLEDRRGLSGASPLSTRFEGEEWRLTADYDVSRYLGASLFYSGDNRRATGATHLVRMEARALF